MSGRGLALGQRLATCAERTKNGGSGPMKHVFVLMAGLGAALVAGATEAQTLKEVKQRGQLICGASAGPPGFSASGAEGNWTGLDVDYCRAIAAAVLGDATKVKFVPLYASNRFEPL